MASVAFQFIDHSTIDLKSRKTIRSHVMKGKNVGKVRAPRRRPVTTLEARPVAKPSTAPSASPIVARPNDTPSSSNPTSRTPSPSSRDRDIELFLSSIPARVGDEFDGLSLVYEAPSQAKRMLHSCERSLKLNRELANMPCSHVKCQHVRLSSRVQYGARGGTEGLG